MMLRSLSSLFLCAAGPLLGFQQPAPVPPPISDVPQFFSFRTIASGTQAFLGVATTEVDSNRARELKLKGEYGVEVTRVEDDSSAAKAGLKVGDVVLEFNGQRVEGTEQFIRLVRETPVGREVRLQISRDGAVQDLPIVMGSHKGRVTLGHNSEFFEMPSIQVPAFSMPDMPQVFTTWNSRILGIEAEALNPQLGEFFGVKEGVLVRSVSKGSSAEKAGLKAGDVLVKVDQSAVTTPMEVASAIRAARSKKTANVELIRGRHPMTVTVAIEDEQGEQPFFQPRGRAIKM